MPLTSRNTGDLIGKAWYNDFLNLLTGTMTDQLVKLIGPMLTLKARSAAPGAPSVAIAAGGSVDTGAHTYAITFVGSDGGGTTAGTTVVATTTGGNNTVQLTAIPTGSTGTTARAVYRSKVGTTTPLFLVTTINDNSTTVYNDTTADASLSATFSPLHPSFGGSVQVQDSTGAVKGQIYSDGAILLDGGKITTSGTGTLSSLFGQATAGQYGTSLVVGSIDDLNVVNNASTTVLTFTTPNDGKNHSLRASAEIFVGGGNTNNGVCDLKVAYTDPHAGALTLAFGVYATTDTVNAYTLAKGLGARTVPREMRCSPNTSVTVTYRNNVSGTISDYVSAMLEILS